MSFILGLPACRTAIEPFVGHVCMCQISNRAVTHASEHVVTLLCGSCLLKVFLIGWIITCSTHQSRHGTSCAGSIGDDYFGITKHFLIEMAKVADRGFQIDDRLRCSSSVDCLAVLPNGRVPPPGSGYHKHVAFF